MRGVFPQIRSTNILRSGFQDKSLCVYCVQQHMTTPLCRRKFSDAIQIEWKAFNSLSHTVSSGEWRGGGMSWMNLPLHYTPLDLHIYVPRLTSLLTSLSAQPYMHRVPRSSNRTGRRLWFAINYKNRYLHSPHIMHKYVHESAHKSVTYVPYIIMRIRRYTYLLHQSNSFIKYRYEYFRAEYKISVG